MPLSLQSRQIGNISVVTCSGRLIEGSESAMLREHLEGLSQDPCVVLNVGAVEFIDSSGLGLLVRLLTRSRAAGGDLKLCDVPPRARDVLKITRLDTLFDMHPSEADAVRAFYEHGGPAATSRRHGTEILCLARSADVLAYLRELLGRAGYGVMTVGTLSDAITLVKATRPKLVVIATDPSNPGDTRAVDTFSSFDATLPTIGLPADFSAHDAGAAAERLLNQINTTLQH